MTVNYGGEPAGGEPVQAPRIRGGVCARRARTLPGLPESGRCTSRQGSRKLDLRITEFSHARCAAWRAENVGGPMQCVIYDRLVNEAGTRTRGRCAFRHAPRPQFNASGRSACRHRRIAWVFSAPGALAARWSLGIRERCKQVASDRGSLDRSNSHERGEEPGLLIATCSHQMRAPSAR
jgi:hypothetical protein